MKWIFLMLTTVVAVRDNAKVMYCVPMKVVEWNRDDLVRTTQQCLDNNFVREHGDIEAWADVYMDALQARRHADKEDQNLISARRELMLTLRDTQLKVTHHTYAVEKCASRANKMPHYIAEEYTTEMELALESSKVWLHHARQDLKHCARVLHDVVSRQQEHLRHHLIDDHVIFVKQLQRAERARENAQKELQHMLDFREELMQLV